MHIKEHLLDKRIVRRALEKGTLSQNDYKRALEQLPDLSDKVKRVEPDQGSGGSPTAEPQ